MADKITGILLCIYIALATETSAAPKKRVCYYGGWAPTAHAPNNLRPEDIDVTLCTHVMFAFATLDSTGIHLRPDDPSELHLYTLCILSKSPNGSCLSTNVTDSLSAGCSIRDFSELLPLELFKGEYKPFTDLKKRNPNLKTMLSVGGWTMGSKLFMKTVQSHSHMLQFAHDAVTFLHAHNFDGLDIDWEYPAARGSGPEDKDNFITLLHTVHNIFVADAKRTNKTRLQLSVAVGVTEGRVKESYNVTGIAKYCDFINLMTYDFHGPWDDTANVHSALYSDYDLNIDRFAKFWVSEGAPKSKLVIGMPLYGHSFTLADTSDQSIGANTTNGGTVAYFKICKMINNHNLTEHMLTTERVPYIVYNDQWIGYDNAESLTEKARYIMDNHYGGWMVWALHLDDVSGACHQGKFPLMHALNKGLIATEVVG